MAAAATGTALVLVVLLLAPWVDRQPSSADTIADEKSVAVLPFENLSAAPDSRYFTDGLHGSVITHLAHVQDLRVIAQTSVLPYRDGSGDLRTVARELNVAHIVEGNVQRNGDRLRVSARLIRAENATNIWAAEYDRAVSDVFTIQADIARQIAVAVDARLRQPEQMKIDRIPTQSPPAYELYLRARDIFRGPRRDRASIEQVIAHLEKAVRLDPQFAQAHAALAHAHDIVYWFGLDPSAERRALVREAADAALRADPDLAEAHVAKGVSLYHGQRDYDGAITSLERARRLAPGDANVHFWAGVIYRRQGRWKEAVAALERAALLDPRNESVLFELAFTLRHLRRYADAADVHQRLFKIAPEHPPRVHLNAARNQFEWTGSLEPIERYLDTISSTPYAGCIIPNIRHGVLIMRRQYREAAAALLACEEDYVAGSAERYPKGLDVGVAYWLAGDHETARRYAKQALIRMEAALQDDPDRPTTRMMLAYAHMILGNPNAARRDVEAALEIMPVSRDAMVGTELIGKAAEVYALLGDRDEALDRLALSLSLPGGVTPHWVRVTPHFDKIREDPRFHELTDPSAARQF